ncbi:MAG: thioredoxin family protein [Caldisericia bacterium]|nr:thioredoxin family protein [Caldisericia bacterium]MDD5689003.1 thioredoxin family protein [Caldisericia bacterium]
MKKKNKKYKKSHKRKRVSFFRKYYKELIFSFIIIVFVGLVTLKLTQNASNLNGSALSSDSNQTGLPKLIDLGTTSCVPCQMMIPVLEELRRDYKGKLIVEFINTAENPSKAQQYGISVIPTQIFFDKNGKEIFRHTGYFSTQEIIDVFKEKGIELR